MGWSLSDSVGFLQGIPRWVWVVIFVLIIISRVWLLIIFMGLAIIIFLILTLFGIIAFAEIIDNDGPGHRGKNWWFK